MFIMKPLTVFSMGAYRRSLSFTFKIQNPMKILFLVMLLLCSFTASFAQWAVKSNGIGDEMAFDVERDANGNNYVIGNYSAAPAVFGSTTLPNFGGTPSCFLAKADANGAFLWAVRMGGTSTFHVQGEAVTTDGTDVFITGQFRGTLVFYGTTATVKTLIGSTTDVDCFIARYNSAGVIQWATKYGGAGLQKPMDIAVSSATQSVFVTGANINKIFINRYNFSGVSQWSGLSLNGTPASGMGITADAAGNSYLISKYTSGPIMLSGSSVTNNGTNNMLLAKYDILGAAVWVQNIGGAGGEFPTGGIGIDGASNLYISGEYTQTANISGISLTNSGNTGFVTTDLFIAKYNNNGIIQWAKKVGGVNSETARGIATDNAGNSFIAAGSQENNSVIIDCQTFPSVLGNTDNKIFVIKYDNAGNVAWATAPKVSDSQTTALGIATNGDGYAVITGGLTGSATFDAITLSNTGNAVPRDAFIAKMKKDPISSDFTLTASFPSGGGSYQLSAIPSATPLGFWWEVSEIDITTGVVVSGTTMTNPSNWWVAPFITNNIFPGYCCNPTTSSGYGVFVIGHKYRITRGTWGPCSPWNSTSKTVYMGNRAMGEKPLVVENYPSYTPAQPN
jgi:hypothetical protein